MTEHTSGERWAELDRANTARRKYKEAMADGLLALQAMIVDLDVGPRQEEVGSITEPSEAQEAKPAHEPSQRSDGAEPARQPKKMGYFGFGPIQ